MAKAPMSSITDAAARDFLNNDSKGDEKELACTKIPGFHLRKRLGKSGPTGSWVIRYKNASGKVRRITIGHFPAMSPAAAAEKASEYRTNINQGIDPLQMIADRKEAQRQREQQELAKQFRTLRLYLEGPYTEHQRHKIDEGKHTLNIIKSSFSELLDRDIDSLCKADVISWQQGMYLKKRVHSTVVRAYGALRTMIKHAVDNEYLEINPIERVRLLPPPAKEQQRLADAAMVKRRRILTPEELQSLQAGLVCYADELREKRLNSRAHGKPHLADLNSVPFPHWVIPFTHLAMHTGLRPGDIRTLTWQELNLTFGRLIKIPRKTLHHPDPIQICQTLNPVILKVMAAWSEQQGKPTTGLVFPSERTEKVLDKAAHVTHWKKIITLGGINSELDFYALRHHFISALVHAGTPMLAVAHLAGHKSVRMIEKHYGHLAPDHAADALEKLGNSLTNLQQPKPSTIVIP